MLPVTRLLSSDWKWSLHVSGNGTMVFFLAVLFAFEAPVTAQLSSRIDWAALTTMSGLPDRTGDEQRRTPASPPTLVSFRGPADDGSARPDIAAAAGTHLIMVATGTEIGIFNKDGTEVFCSSLEDFWSGFTNVVQGVDDPRLMYDSRHDRWIFSANADPALPSSALMLAVSVTSDPLGAWIRCRIPEGSARWINEGNLGLNEDWIVVTRNIRSLSGAFLHSRVYVFDRASLYAVVNPFEHPPAPILSTLELDAESPAPAFMHDTGRHLHLLANASGDNGRGQGILRLFVLNQQAGEFSCQETAKIGNEFNWGDFPPAGQENFFPQWTTSSRIAAEDSRIQNLVQRHNTLWATHTVFLPAEFPTRAAVQWWQLNTNGTVIQTGRIDDPNSGRSHAFPTLAVNRFNDVMIGHSVFASTNYPTAAYSFRYGFDPKNFLQLFHHIHSGSTIYVRDDPSDNLNHWVRHSATFVDPANDEDLWTAQAYSEYQSGWRPAIGKVVLPEHPDGDVEVIYNPPVGTIFPELGTQVITATVFDKIPVTNSSVLLDFVGDIASYNMANNGVLPDVLANDNIYTGNRQIPVNTPILTNIVRVFSPFRNTLRFTNFYHVLPSLDHDDIVNAQPLRLERSIMGAHNSSATRETDEPLHAGVNGGRSVWFSLNSPVSGFLTLSTSNSAVDTVMALYRGDRFANLQLVAENDDAAPGRRDSHIIAGVFAGTEYRIALDGFEGQSGFIQLNISFQTNNLQSLHVSKFGDGLVNPPGGVFRSNSTVSLHAIPNLGSGFVAWEGDIYSLENPLQVTLDTDLNLRAVFGPQPISDRFDSGDFSSLVGWQHPTADRWTVVPATGDTGSLAVAIGTSARTNVVLQLAHLMQQGTGSFDYRLRIATNSGRWEFRMNNVVLFNGFNSEDWTRTALPVAAGTNLLEWILITSNNFAGTNFAFIDNIDLPLRPLVDPNIPIVINQDHSIVLDGRFQFRVNGQTNQSYIIEASSDLGFWQPLQTNHARFGLLQFWEVIQTDRRFFRVRTLP